MIYMHRFVKTLVLTLVSMIFLCCNQCFAEYKYIPFFSENGYAQMRAPITWKQSYPGSIGDKTVLLQLTAPDANASAVLMFGNEYVPYNSLDDVSEEYLNSMVLNDTTKLKSEYPSMVLLETATNRRVKDVRNVSYVFDITLPYGRYRYYTFKSIRNHHFHILSIMAHESLIKQLDVVGMVYSLFVYGDKV